MKWTRQPAKICRIEVVNSLVSSLFVYKFKILPNVSAESVKKINDLIVHFVWNGRKPKIQLHTLTLDKEYSGCRLVDIKHRDATLKVQWVQRLTSEDQMLKALAYYHIIARIFGTELT